MVGPGRLAAEIPDPSSAPHLTIFVLPGQMIPPDKGVAVFWAAPPFTSWSTLGTLSHSHPSGIFHTGWPANKELLSCPVVQIGISVETADTVSNLSDALSVAESEKLGFGLLVARHLFRHLGSFVTTNSATKEEVILLPARELDAWLQKFEAKFRADPSFLLRGEG